MKLYRSDYVDRLTDREVQTLPRWKVRAVNERKERETRKGR